MCGARGSILQKVIGRIRMQNCLGGVRKNLEIEILYTLQLPFFLRLSTLLTRKRGRRESFSNCCPLWMFLKVRERWFGFLSE